MEKGFVEIKISKTMTVKKSVKSIVNERLKPRIWQWAYLGLGPILRNIKEFSSFAKQEGVKKILDLGCGVKPYQSLFCFADKFIGLDAEKNEQVDVVAFNWELPFENGEFDAIIATQSLEHTEKIFEAVAEIKRVLKKNGLVFVSVPLIFPEHEIPHDYYRFTKYGLISLFKDFEIIKIVPLNGFINTLFRALNLFLHYFPGAKYYLFPLFFINNILALFFDKFAFFMVNLFGRPELKEYYEDYYMGFTTDYVVVLKNSK